MKNNINSSWRVRGAVLISVMLILSVLVVFVSYMVESQYILIRQASLFDKTENSFLASRRAETWAVSKLIKADNNNVAKDLFNFDSLTEPWSKDEMEVTEQGAKVTATLEDLQGRLNLNNLASGTASSFYPIFIRLLTGLGIDSPNLLAQAIIDWIDSDQNGIYEDIEYSNLVPQMRTSNQNLRSLSEIQKITGIDKVTYDLLIQYVTVLPGSDVKINLQTASLEMLKAILPDGQSSTKAIELHDDILENSFNTLLSLTRKHIDYAGKDDLVDIKSNYFELKTIVETPFNTFIYKTGFHRDILITDQKIKINTIFRERA